MTDTTANEKEWTSTDDDWSDAQQVAEEFKFDFTEIGDVFIGRYQGMDPATRNGIIVARFTKDGEDWFTVAGIDLVKKLKKVPYGKMVRIEWTDNLDTGQDTPMRVFDVKWRQ